MLRSTFVSLLSISTLLTACVQQYEPPSNFPPEQPATVDEAIQEASSQDNWNEITLVDQSFESTTTAKGADWLRAIGTKLVRGNIEDGYLDIELSRGPSDDGKGWAAVGMYIAPKAVSTLEDGTVLFEYPDESAYGTHLHFINAEWNGNCKRALAPSSSFGVIQQHDNAISVPLYSVPMTVGDDGCQTGTTLVDLMRHINGGGLYIGLSPSDASYHLTVTLRYKGTVETTAF